MIDNDKFVMSVIKTALLLLFLEILFVMIFFSERIPLALGFLLGGGLSIVFFRLMYLNILIALGKSEAKARRFITINYFLRYIIYGLVLVIAAKTEFFNIFTTALGFFNIKIAMYLQNLLPLLRQNKKGR